MKISFLAFLAILSGMAQAQTNLVPDPTFGTNGTKRHVMANGSSQLFSSGIQSTGKIIGGGYALNHTRDLLVTRTNPDGSPDNSFGLNGTVFINSQTAEENFGSIVVLADDKIIVSGTRKLSVSSGTFGIVCRLNPNGIPDNSFGNSGTTEIKPISTTSFTWISKVRAGSDGKLYLSGYYVIQGNERCFVGRLTSQGIIDSTFGTNGFVNFNFSTANSRNYSEDLEILPDGKLLVFGRQFTTRFQLGMARLSSNGTLDNTFSTDGVHVFSVTTGQNYAVRTASTSDNKVLFFAYANVSGAYQVYVGRMNSDGTTDNTFGSAGSVSFQNFNGGSFAYDVARMANGNFLIAGDSYNGTRYIATAYQIAPTGELVSGFGTGGKFSNPVTSSETSAYSVSVSGSEFYLSGAFYSSTQNAYSGMILKVQSNGNLNSAFGTSGQVIRNESKPNAVSQKISLLPGNKILAFGTQQNNVNDLFFTRCNSDGSLDPSFAGTGINRVNLGGNNEFTSRSILPNGDFVGLATSAYVTISYPGLVTLTGPGAYSIFKISASTGFQAASRVNNTISANQFTFPADIHALPNGKVLVLASATTSAIARTAFLIRHNPNLAIDNTFGTSGKKEVLSSHNQIYGVVNMAVDSDGKIVILSQGSDGGSQTGSRLLRLDSTGANDVTFGNNIVPGVALHIEPSATAFQPNRLFKTNSGYVISGTKEGAGSLCWISQTGSLLGYTPLPGFSGLIQVVSQPDGSLFVGGTGNNQIRFARILPNGQLDLNFGESGIITSNYFGDQATLVDLVAPSSTEVWALARVKRDFEGEEMGLLKLKADGTVNINQKVETHLTEVFPNPVSGNSFWIRGSSEISKVELVDVKGCQVPISISTVLDGGRKLEIQGEPKPGIYFLQIESNQSAQTHKLLIR